MCETHCDSLEWSLTTQRRACLRGACGT